MLIQGIIDAIVDLAILVATAYQDGIGDLELDVLTEPSIKRNNSPYVITSEITMVRKFVNPIVNLINALRDHNSASSSGASNVPGDLKRPTTGIKISPMAQTYLGDVEDHIILITESLDQKYRSCVRMYDRTHIQHDLGLPERIYGVVDSCHYYLLTSYFLDWVLRN